MKQQGMFPHLPVASATLALLFMQLTSAAAENLDAKDPWPELAREIFQDRPIASSAGLIDVVTPARAEDAALVPLTIRLSPTASRQVKKITLIIDNNPAPVAAVFTLAEELQISTLSTRVRVNEYTKIHVVAEMRDATLLSAERYVKAAGGCSAPAVKSLDEATANLGQMKFRYELKPDKREAEAMVMVRHPNNSGLQMDQVSRLYIQARYIDSLKILQDEKPVLSMEGGISLSEDPQIRFTYQANQTATVRVDAHDTAGSVFSGTWPLAAPM
jgi:sulfur-oxidizing protein SoxY